ncbi:Hypothetical protein RADP37_05388 [Roseomonas mucosa]|uniref:KAP NTPase domain-containing protein n=2 Tax=Roseomonas mucosa TaxID=207340 RepID=A0A4Y1N258_9PROT|nr:Hypothetical protein RADP37_05388 [Roseomonas mucosa]
MMKISEIEWGDDSAEKDQQLLEYFVTSDALNRLTKKNKSLVIGRKGTGKSALFAKLTQVFSEQDRTHVVTVKPSYNSINNLMNDQVVARNFGVEIFFQHCWIRHLYKESLIQIGATQSGFAPNSYYAFARKIAATENYVGKDIVDSIIDFISRLRIKAGTLGELGISLEKNLREEGQIAEYERNLSGMLDSGEKVVILVDDLDLGWNNSELSNSFLMGLLSAVSHVMSSHKNLHVVIFLREDIYNLVLKSTQHSDKFRNVERIKWDKEKLVSVLSARINFNRIKAGLPDLGDAAFFSVFPETVGTANTDNWLIERTLSRPRELIQFARNYSESVESTFPSDAALKSAEPEYSRWKLADVCSEYRNQYPDLSRITSQWTTKFQRRKYHLKREEIGEILKAILNDVDIDEAWYKPIKEKMDTDKLLEILFEIGLIGDFMLGGAGGGSKTYYSYEDFSDPQFDEVQIHPCFRRALNTVERIRENNSQK